MVQEMYNAGARLFVVFNIPPGGCTSYYLTLYEGMSPKDEYGCLTDYNRAFDAYNQELNATMYEYRQNWTDVKIFLYDYYSATYEIVKHPETYGEVLMMSSQISPLHSGSSSYTSVFSGRRKKSDFGDVSQYLNPSTLKALLTVIHEKYSWDYAHYNRNGAKVFQWLKLL